MDSIEQTKDVMLGNMKTVHDRVYPCSNEDLFQLFSKLNINGKKILSVLASSDQPFHLSRKNPASVETFDINSLAIYYYYLRRWGILYCNQYYPNFFSSDEIMHILSFVHPESDQEKDAYDYWEEYSRTFSPFYTGKFFYTSCRPNFNRLDDLRRLKKYLESHDFSFHNIDISSTKIPSKYDLIVVSNIPEYYSLSSEKMNSIASNLNDMLYEGGEVVTSFVMHLNETYTESRSFRQYFDRQVIYDRKGKSIGCKYKKRVLTKNS